MSFRAMLNALNIYIAQNLHDLSRSNSESAHYAPESKREFVTILVGDGVGGMAGSGSEVDTVTERGRGRGGNGSEWIYVSVLLQAAGKENVTSRKAAAISKDPYHLDNGLFSQG